MKFSHIWQLSTQAMLVHPDFNPVAFEIGPLAIRWYGLSYVAGIVAAWWLLHIRARHRDGWSADDVADLIFYSAIGVVLGGRLGYALFYRFNEYLSNPLEILKVWEGGMSFHGGMLGVLVAVVFFARQRQRRVLACTDYLIPVVPLGLMSGRLANFVNGELWGAPSNLPWAMVFHDPRAGEIARHPSQLYQAVLEGLLLFIVLWTVSRQPKAVGFISGLFLLGYGILRGLVEFVREPDAHLGYLAFGWLTMGQVLCVPMIIAGIWLMLWSRHQETV